jgi:hypothetical protein
VVLTATPRSGLFSKRCGDTLIIPTKSQLIAHVLTICQRIIALSLHFLSIILSVDISPITTRIQGTGVSWMARRRATARFES